MTVSNSTILAYAIGAFATTLLPILILVVLGIRKKLSVKPMFIGVLAFFVSQVVLRLPILSVLGMQPWFKSFATDHYVLYVALIGGLTAGLFEETARYLGTKFILKNQRGYRDAISFGLGHGFCEAIIITGLTFINYLVYCIMINGGTFDSIAKAMPGDTAQQLIFVLTATTAGSIYIGILERVFAVTFHVFATVLIFKGIKTNKIGYYFLAVLAHTILNSGVALLGKYTNVWAAEGFLLAFTVFALLYIIRQKKAFTDISSKIPTVQPIA
jgi:uncharacterized membrane protein YhfC